MAKQIGERPDGPAVLGASGAEFTVWIRPHLRQLGYLLARPAPRADRDDLLQEVHARAWANWHSYDPQRSAPATWLSAIAAHTAARARRSRRHHAPLDAAMATAATTQIDGHVSLRVDVERALRRLSRRQRIAIECRYFVGLGITETAAVMGCSEGTVKSTLADARARLRRMLEVTE